MLTVRWNRCAESARQGDLEVTIMKLGAMAEMT